MSDNGVAQEGLVPGQVPEKQETRRVRFSDNLEQVKLIPKSAAEEIDDLTKRKMKKRNLQGNQGEPGIADADARPKGGGKRRCAVPSLNAISSFEEAARLASEMRTARRREAQAAEMESLVQRRSEVAGARCSGVEEWDEDLLGEESDPEEREDGHFDAHGNYIDHVLSGKQLNDPWLESIDEKGKAAEKRSAGIAAAAAAAASMAQMDEVEEMDEDDLALYRGRVANLLEPGENVLQALRRLGGMNRKQQALSGRGPKPNQRGKKRASAQAATADLNTGAAERDQGKASSTAGPQSTSTVGSDAGKAASTSGAVNLSQELSSPSHLRALAPTGAAGRTPTHPPAPSPTGAEGRKGAAAERERRESKSRRVPAENSIDFEKLTHYADLLLGQV
eukprot:gene18445-24920_t